jgi:hypothetical protein
MNESHRKISTVAQLLEAVGDDSVQTIEVERNLHEVPTVKLAKGQSLAGADYSVTLCFARGSDGIMLCTDNTIENLFLEADSDHLAVFNDTSVATLGRLELRRIRTIGCVRLIASDSVRGGHVEAREVDIVAGDARGHSGSSQPDVLHAQLLRNRPAIKKTIGCRSGQNASDAAEDAAHGAGSALEDVDRR